MTWLFTRHEQPSQVGGDRCRAEAELATLDLPTDQDVSGTSVWSDRAQVRTSSDVLFLVEMPDGWRVAAAGCTRQPDETYQCQLEE